MQRIVALFGLLALVALTGCEKTLPSLPDDNPSRISMRVKGSDGALHYTVVMHRLVDPQTGCEYLYYPAGNSSVMVPRIGKNGVPICREKDRLEKFVEDTVEATPINGS